MLLRLDSWPCWLAWLEALEPAGLVWAFCDVALPRSDCAVEELERSEPAPAAAVLERSEPAPAAAVLERSEAEFDVVAPAAF